MHAMKIAATGNFPGNPFGDEFHNDVRRDTGVITRWWLDLDQPWTVLSPCLLNGKRYSQINRLEYMPDHQRGQQLCQWVTHRDNGLSVIHGEKIGKRFMVLVRNDTCISS